VLLETTQILSDAVSDEVDNEGTISDGNVKWSTLYIQNGAYTLQPEISLSMKDSKNILLLRFIISSIYCKSY
jgi:hypothetical protein